MALKLVDPLRFLHPWGSVECSTARLIVSECPTPLTYFAQIISFVKACGSLRLHHVHDLSLAIRPHSFFFITSPVKHCKCKMMSHNCVIARSSSAHDLRSSPPALS